MKEVAGDDSTHKIVEVMGDGTSPASANRWLRKGVRPDAEKVVSFCRGYGENPVVGLVHAGYVTAEEAASYAFAVRSTEDLLADLESLSKLLSESGSPDIAEMIRLIRADIARRTVPHPQRKDRDRHAEAAPGDSSATDT